jgi:hypothetical protein
MLSLHTKMKQKSIILCTVCTVRYIEENNVLFRKMYSFVEQARAISLKHFRLKIE